jgi:hypothetical protein
MVCAWSITNGYNYDYPRVGKATNHPVLEIDWYAFQTDPRGPASDQGSGRVSRGGNWNYYAVDCRNSYRYGNSPTDSASNIGFRCALPVT